MYCIDAISGWYTEVYEPSYSHCGDKGDYLWTNRTLCKYQHRRARSLTLILTTTRHQGNRRGATAVLKTWVEKLMRSENFEMALDELVWLITLLANQSVLVHSLRTPGRHARSCSREETVELLTSPAGIGRATNPPSREAHVSRARSEMWKARPTQKTHLSGNRRGTVHPAFLLRNGAAASSVWGGLADAVRFSPRPVGMSQAVSRHGEARNGRYTSMILFLLEFKEAV